MYGMCTAVKMQWFSSTHSRTDTCSAMPKSRTLLSSSTLQASYHASPRGLCGSAEPRQREWCGVVWSYYPTTMPPTRRRRRRRQRQLVGSSCWARRYSGGYADRPGERPSAGRSASLDRPWDRKVDLTRLEEYDELGLIQGQRLLLIDLDRCTRCGDCVTACVNTHDDGYTRLFLDGPRIDRYMVPSACRQLIWPAI